VGKTTVIYVKFLRDVACQKLFKSANFSRSYSKNNTGTVFLRHGAWTARKSSVTIVALPVSKALRSDDGAQLIARLSRASTWHQSEFIVACSQPHKTYSTAAWSMWLLHLPPLALLADVTDC